MHKMRAYGAEQLLLGKWPEPERWLKSFEVFHADPVSVFTGSEVTVVGTVVEIKASGIPYCPLRTQLLPGTKRS